MSHVGTVIDDAIVAVWPLASGEPGIWLQKVVGVPDMLLQVGIGGERSVAAPDLARVWAVVRVPGVDVLRQLFRADEALPTAPEETAQLDRSPSCGRTRDDDLWWTLESRRRLVEPGRMGLGAFMYLHAMYIEVAPSPKDLAASFERAGNRLVSHN